MVMETGLSKPLICCVSPSANQAKGHSCILESVSQVPLPLPLLFSFSAHRGPESSAFPGSGHESRAAVGMRAEQQPGHTSYNRWPSSPEQPPLFGFLCLPGQGDQRP